MSAILRHRHPNRFTVLPNDAIRNPALSFRAVGVLAHLLSLPDGAKVDSATLAAAHKEGRDAVRAAYRELEVHGYYRREIIRLADGTLRTEVVVSSTPMTGAGAGRTGDGKSGVGPKPGNPAPVKPTSGAPTPVDQAATEVPTIQQLIPPQPPRPAGGSEIDRGRAGSRRTPLEPEVRARPPGLEPPPGATGESAGETPDTPQRSQRFRRGPYAAGEHGFGTEPHESPTPKERWAQPALSSVDGARRQPRTGRRALGTNPRAEAERAEAARLEAEAATRQAEVERRVEERRLADEAAEREAQRLEAEGLALSAVLNDETLAEMVRLVSASMVGPLARSPMAIARAVLSWCRAAVARHPGPLAEAVRAGLAAGLAAGEGTASTPLALPPAPVGTPSLRRRIAHLRETVGVP